MLTGDCAAGTEWSEVIKACLECPVRFFRTGYDTVFCSACPDGFTTPHTGSTSEKACNISLRQSSSITAGLSKSHICLVVTVTVTTASAAIL